MALTETLKRMLDALAYANLPEYQSTSKKHSLIAACPATITNNAVGSKAADPIAARPQVGLYLGSELPDYIMQYALQTCGRLGYGLTVLTYMTNDEARTLLAPYQATLEANATEIRLMTLTGEPPAPLTQALRRRSDIAFLICNESGYMGNGLLNGRVHKDAIPVPVVMVTRQDAIPTMTQKQTGATNVA